LSESAWKKAVIESTEVRGIVRPGRAQKNPAIPQLALWYDGAGTEKRQRIGEKLPSLAIRVNGKIVKFSHSHHGS
jgi:hypothetical protein